MDKFNSMAETLAAHGYLANPGDKERVAFCLRTGFPEPPDSAEEKARYEGHDAMMPEPSAKGEADELDKSLAVNIYNIATRGPWKTMPPDWPEVNERIQEIANKLSTRRPSAEPAKDAPRLPYKD